MKTTNIMDIRKSLVTGKVFIIEHDYRNGCYYEESTSIDLLGKEFILEKIHEKRNSINSDLECELKRHEQMTKGLDCLELILNSVPTQQ